MRPSWCDPLFIYLCTKRHYWICWHFQVQAGLVILLLFPADQLQQGSSWQKNWNARSTWYKKWLLVWSEVTGVISNGQVYKSSTLKSLLVTWGCNPVHKHCLLLFHYPPVKNMRSQLQKTTLWELGFLAVNVPLKAACEHTSPQISYFSTVTVWHNTVCKRLIICKCPAVFHVVIYVLQ